MLSIPPATAIRALPARIRSWASIAAFMPEPHILLMVVAVADSGRPAAKAAWRAGAWPSPAGSTQPISTSSIASGATPARATAPRIAAAPRSGAVAFDKAPWKAPSAVRAVPTMTTGSVWAMVLSSRWQTPTRPCVPQAIGLSFGRRFGDYGDKRHSE